MYILIKIVQSTIFSTINVEYFTNSSLITENTNELWKTYYYNMV